MGSVVGVRSLAGEGAGEGDAIGSGRGVSGWGDASREAARVDVEDAAAGSVSDPHPLRSHNSAAHATTGCSQEDLISWGGVGLFYCFAVD